MDVTAPTPKPKTRPLGDGRMSPVFEDGTDPTEPSAWPPRPVDDAPGVTHQRVPPLTTRLDS